MKKEKLQNLLTKKVKSIESLINTYMLDDGSTCQTSQRMCLLSGVNTLQHSINWMKQKDLKHNKERITRSDIWWKIDGTLIKEDIFNEELYDYCIVDIEDEKSNLYICLSETKDESERSMMEEDLEQLIRSDDSYILSSVNTNEYIDSTFWDVYNNHCNSILGINI